MPTYTLLEAIKLLTLANISVSFSPRPEGEALAFTLECGDKYLHGAAVADMPEHELAMVLTWQATNLGLDPDLVYGPEQA